MKKIVLGLLLILPFAGQSLANSNYISQKCETTTTNIVCNDYKSYQDKMDSFFDNLKNKYSETTLKVKLRLLLSKLDTLKNKYQSAGKYKGGVEFIFEYIDYQANNILDELQNSNENNNNSDNENDTKPSGKVYIKSLENNITLSVGSKKVDFLKFNITNETDEDIYLKSFDLTGDIEAFKQNNFRLNYDNTSKTLSSFSIKIAKNSEKTFVLNGDMADSFSGKFSLILDNFVFANNQGKDTQYTLDNTSIKGDYEIKTQNYVEEDSSNPVDEPVSNILAGNNEIAVANYKLRVKYMDCLIKELTLVNVGTGTQTEISSSNYSLYDGADNNVNKVYIYTSAGKKLGEANMINGLVNFQFSEPVLVPVNQDFYLVVKVKLNKVGNINMTNKFLKLGMLKPGDTINQNGSTYTTNIVTKNTGVKISGLYIGSFDGSVGNLQILRKSTINISGLSQSNHSLVANASIFGFSALAQGDSNPAIKEFRFNTYVYNSPNASNLFKILGNSFSLTVNGTRISSNDIKFYNTLGKCSELGGNEITGTSDLSFVDTNNYQYCVRAVFDGAYNKGYTLTPGTNYEFKINANPVGFGEYSSINTNFDDLSNYKDKGTYSDVLNQNTSFVWSDNSADYLDLSFTNWFSDYLLNLYDVGSWTVNN